MAEYSASTIAKWFVAWVEDEEADLSNLKLQKLLYYAQGWHLRETGKPLFQERICAWSHGPVVPEIYHQYKGFGSGDVTLSPDDPFEWSDVDPETTRLLIKVWNTYGGFGAWRLRNMTPTEPPWRNHFERDGYNVGIPNDEIREYFRSLAPVT